jgi:hypothetical protein
MDIQFDPFSFGVATIALADAIMQLFWNRPQHRDVVRQSSPIYLLVCSF